MVSKTCEYAIRAMLFIAQKSKSNTKVGVKHIAKAIDSPEPFIAKILQELSRKGLLLSAKGPTGGFFLDNSLLKQSLADIVSAVDGDRLFTGCGLGLKSCSEKKPCPIHDEFVAIRKKIKTVMQSAILGDYNTSLDLGEKYLKR
ncbi:MAG TPA: Rrf2 family transcriptional regulator [Bacteroidia bacterium]|nr:Rrf2 family transcriptional regulator [Bacteroidia bacterium]